MKLSSSRFLFTGRFLIIDLFSSLLLVCSYFIITSWFSLDKLYVSSNLSISSSHQICWCIGVQKGNKRTSRGTRDQIANICWIIEEARELQKNIHICFIDYAKAFDCVDPTNGGTLFKRWENQATLRPSEKSTCRSRSNS